jgi:hypothetical protein
MEWNWRALGDLFATEQTTADDTLDRNVLRTPPGSILTYANRRLDVSYLVEWGTRAKRSVMPTLMAPSEALRALQNEIALFAGPNPTLSASGGFDSRVLLAGLLQAGYRPRMVVIGPPNGFDRAISTTMARILGLSLEPIELKVENYLESGTKIVVATDGTKPAAHWHTYIYTRKAGLTADDRFFIGTNGEFARTYYYNHGLGAIKAQIRQGQENIKEFWLKKLKWASPFQSGEHNELAKSLAEELSEQGATERAERFTRLGHDKDYGFLDNLDKFYTTQRVGRSFGGNGIRLYSLTTTPIMPMLSKEWSEAIERMPRFWKLGEGWHRYAIARMYPDLLAFPDAYGESMARVAGLRYWLNRQYPKQQVLYFEYSQLFSDNRFLEMVQGLSASLSEVIDENLLNRIVEQQRQGKNRSRALSVLVSIGLWKKQVQDLRAPHGPVTT